MMDSSKKSYIKWLWALLLTGIIIWAILTPYPSLQLQKFIDNIHSMGAISMLLFILCYVVATVILIPGLILTLGAGAIFGIWKGFLLVSIASTIAASAAFLLGRQLAGKWFLSKIGHNSRMNALKGAIESEGWKIVILARLSPLIPYTMLNYMFSLTSLRFSHYVIASWLGMIPVTFVYVYIGSLGSLGTNREKTTIEWILIASGIIATATGIFLINRAASKEMAKRLDGN
jgi:uncharacterized membrane protein YdjX (TVP38/TMEM64 family)